MATTLKTKVTEGGNRLELGDNHAVAEFISDQVLAKFQQKILNRSSEKDIEREIQDEQLHRVVNLFRSGGRTRSGTQLSWHDAITSTEILPLIPRVVETIVQMPMEPTIILQNLLTKVTIPLGQLVSFPSIGALPAEAKDMGEAEQYPTIGKPDMQGSMTARVGKVGCKVTFTDEVWRLSQSAASFNIVSYMLNAVSNSLARTKERKAAEFIFRQGRVAFDNLSVSGRRTSGRDHAGALNGTLLANDLVQLQMEMLADGFVPDIMIMHPMAFPMFVRDNELRTWIMMNGGDLSGLFQPVSGESGFRKYAQTTPPMHRRHDPITTLSTLHTKPFENQLGFSLRPVITPWAYYTPQTSNHAAYVDIVIADSRHLGWLVEEEGLKSGSWADPETDIKNFRVSEKYTFATDLNGAGIRVIKGISVDRYAFDFLNNFRYSPTFANPINLTGFTVGGTSPIA